MLNLLVHIVTTGLRRIKYKVNIFIMNSSICCIQDSWHIIMYSLNWLDLCVVQGRAPYFLDSAYKEGNVHVLRVVLVGYTNDVYGHS
jgi:hypothetical protein